MSTNLDIQNVPQALENLVFQSKVSLASTTELLAGNHARVIKRLPVDTLSADVVQCIRQYRGPLNFQELFEPTTFKHQQSISGQINRLCYLIVPVRRETSKLAACFGVIVWSRNFLRYHSGESLTKAALPCPVSITFLVA